MRLAGIDLAWNGESNPSAIAIGTLAQNRLTLEYIEPAATGLNSILDIISGYNNIEGIAIDASLIINNKTGFRECETELNKVYRSKWAGCHPTNRSLYPDAFSVKLANRLKILGFEYVLGNKWQIECYPHASIIELFGLEKRLLYKKGSVSDKQNGQKLLARYINSLTCSNTIKLIIPDQISNTILSPAHIDRLKGSALKTNEDALDSIICLYTAALYALKHSGHHFGNALNGFIWVPNSITNINILQTYTIHQVAFS